MEFFVYNTNPQRVIFGAGSIANLPQELSRLGKSAALVLCGPGPSSTARAAQIKTLLGDKVVNTYTNAAMHTPTNITEEALGFARQTKNHADCLISVGGGSAIGLGKAISFRSGLPHICLPTTYAGSEMTGSLGETEGGLKRHRKDPKIVPAVVIYDLELTLSLSPGMSATSGVNAMAHSVEALYSENKNPITSLLALEGIKALAESLPVIMDFQFDMEVRLKAQYGAWLCGSACGTVMMGLHHKLCHTLGGSFNMPHSETHTILLPHSLSYNALAIPEVMKQLANVLPNSDGNAIKGLNSLLTKLRVKRALKDYGLLETDLDKAAQIACSATYPNPRPIEQDKVRELLRRAWAGEEARADF
jgi:alcohol dehydrogenase class IV